MREGEGKNRNAYRAIKALVTDGDLVAGVRLDPEHLKDEIGASLTTIYNALRCLVVERLIEGSPSEGFHMPTLTEAILRGRYRWACDLAIMAARGAAPALDMGIGPTAPPAHRVDDASSVATRTEALFARIAARPEIFEYRMAMTQANDRLRALRRFEPLLLDGLEAELTHLTTAMVEPDAEMLVAALIRHRDRRLPLADALLRRLAGERGRDFA